MQVDHGLEVLDIHMLTFTDTPRAVVVRIRIRDRDRFPFMISALTQVILRSANQRVEWSGSNFKTVTVPGFDGMAFDAVVKVSFSITFDGVISNPRWKVCIGNIDEDWNDLPVVRFQRPWPPPQPPQSLMMSVLKKRVSDLVNPMKRRCRKSDDQMCTICLEEFADRQTIVGLSDCNHIFHPKCIKVWFEKKASELRRHLKCPNCRTEYVIE